MTEEDSTRKDLQDIETLRTQLSASQKLVSTLQIFSNYYQLGEERVVINILERIAAKEKLQSFYVDIGGYHPIIGSNTYKLYQKGWRGLIVEPNPTKTQYWSNSRPLDIVITKAVIPDDWDLDSVVMSAEGSQDARESVLTPDSMRRDTGHTYSAQTLKVGDLFKLLRSAGIRPSFVSIDIEGLENSLIEGSNFYEQPIPIICIEHFLKEFSLGQDIFGYQKSSLVQKLVEADYLLVSICGVSLIFSHKQYFVPYN